MKLTRRYRFSASHRLHSARLSEDENRNLYGKCNNPYGHGHDYVLDVSVRGPLDTETGRIVDLDRLDTLIADQVIARLDHKNLNVEVDAFQKVAPTTENLASEIQRTLRQAWPEVFGEGGPRLDGIAIEETKRNYIELK